MASRRRVQLEPVDLSPGAMAKEGEEEEDWDYYDPDVELSDFWKEILGGNNGGEASGAAAAAVVQGDPDPVKAWLRMFKDASDSGDPDRKANLFSEYWRVAVPRVLAPQPGRTSLEFRPDEERAERALLRPLEAFIAGGSDRVEETMARLSEQDTPPALCGKAFGLGEPVYSCRECSQDATCVMCSECFQHSKHKRHRYRMSTSEGDGGYCDCGDTEAFLKDAVCSKHEALKVTQGSSQETLDKFPPEVRARTEELFRAICHYCLYVSCNQKRFDDLSVGTKDKEVFSELKYCFQYANYCLLLLNDASHSVTEVINVLRSSFAESPHQPNGRGAVTPRQAISLTEFVDREGRAILLVGDYKDCASLRDRMNQRCRAHGLEVPLKTKVVPSHVVAHQAFAVRLTSWLVGMFARCSGFRALFAEVFLSTDASSTIELPDPKITGRVPTPSSTRRFHFAEKVVTGESDFWKEMRRAWVRLIIEGVLKEYGSKLKFARLFVENYGTIMENFVRDDQEADVTVVNLSVQFFTVKSIAQTLLCETDVFSKLVNIFSKRIIEHVSDFGHTERDPSSFQSGMDLNLQDLMEDQKEEFDRYQCVLTDLMYLLRVPLQDPDRYTDRFRIEFARGTEAFLHLLSYLQFCDPHRRQTGHHVEYESGEWEYVGKMVASLASISLMIHKWCARDKGTLIAITNNAIKSIMEEQGPMSSCSFKLAGPSSKEAKYEITAVNVLKDKVSVNVPYQRFLAGLMPSFNAFGEEFASSFARRLASHGDIFHLVDPLITAVAALGTMDAGMWRMNGTPALGMSFLYHNFYLCPSLKRHDLIMLQSAICSIEDPGRITFALLERFQLEDWADKKLEKPWRKGNKDEDEILKTTTRAEIFLQLILAAFLERHVHGVGEVSEREELRYRVIQLLCAEAMAHSRVMESLEVVEEEVSLVDEELKAVADPEGAAGKRVYKVKKEFQAQFNPFYYYYNTEHASKALYRQLELKKKAKDRPLCPPPRLPRLCHTFKGLPAIASTPPVVKAIMCTLERAGESKKQNKYFTPKMVRQVCFLISQACQDDLTYETEGRFVRLSEEMDLAGKLRAVLTSPHEDLKAEDIRELVGYTLDRLNEARSSILNVGLGRQDSLASEAASSSSSDLASASTSTSGGVGAEDAAAAAARKRRAEAAAHRRQKMLAQMSAQQSKFAKQHASDLETVELDSTPTPSAEERASQGFFSDQGAIPKGSRPETHAVAVGPRRTPPAIVDSSKCYTCILCQADQCLSLSGDPSQDALVTPAHIQNSTVLSQTVDSAATALPCRSRVGDDHLSLTADCAPAVVSCGHVMHARCYQNFMDDLVKKERMTFGQGMVRPIKNYDVNLNEYLCPICSRLSNSVLPLAPAVSALIPSPAHRPSPAGGQQSFYAWAAQAKEMATNKTLEELSDSVAKETRRASNSSDLPRIVLAPRRSARLAAAATAASRGSPAAPRGPKLSAPLPEMLGNMASTFTLNLLSKSLGLDIVTDDYRTLQLCFQACSTSLHFFQARRDSKPLLGGATERDLDVLRSMVRLCVIHPLTDQNPKKSGVSAQSSKHHPSSGTGNNMRYLRANGLYLLSVFLLDDQGKSFLQIDPLNALMILTAAVPAITYPETERTFALGRDDHHVLCLCLAVHLLQVLVGFSPLPEEERRDLPDCPYADQQALLRLRKQVCACTGAGFTETAPAADFGAQVRHKIERFLRCAALFYHFYTDVPLPPELASTSIPPTHEALCRYLGLPETLRDFLLVLGVQDTVDRLLHSGRVHKTYAPDLPLRPRKLIDLPSEYRTLVDRAAAYRCPNNKLTGECRHPCLCLVCGEMVCSHSSCCEEMVNGMRSGGCTAHAFKCGATQGIFLRLRKCEVLLLSECKRGLILPAPYVDDYGECDEGLRRGNPLHLDRDMYEDLQRTWTTNDIPDRISRSFDDEVIVIRAVWHQL